MKPQVRSGMCSATVFTRTVRSPRERTGCGETGAADGGKSGASPYGSHDQAPSHMTKKFLPGIVSFIAQTCTEGQFPHEEEQRDDKHCKIGCFTEKDQLHDAEPHIHTGGENSAYKAGGNHGDADGNPHDEKEDQESNSDQTASEKAHFGLLAGFTTRRILKISWKQNNRQPKATTQRKGLIEIPQ